MFNSKIDPIKTSAHIKETYLRYLATTFKLSDMALSKQFQEIVEKSANLFRGPILEMTPKYKKGRSLYEIINGNDTLLTKEFLNYAPGLSDAKLEEQLPLKRELYVHQENAIRKISKEHRNVVIATGTGSGKTECFLLPIINYLLEERKYGKLGLGVRALIIYPMNALANDQIERLRQLIPPETGITFGRYTGQTKQTYSDGLELFRQEHANENPQPNELFCRDQILGRKPYKKDDWPHKEYEPFVGPPHILLTNYAMLEYLLLRPEDSVLFDWQNGKTWKFIVLDEAHIYTGARGIEIAYLIRRLKDRVCFSEKGRLTCIATSATIGVKDHTSKQIIANSFSNLFDETFNEEDIITGETVPSEAYLQDETWGEGSLDFYKSLGKIIESNHLSSAKDFIERITKELLPKARSNDGWPSEEFFRYTIERIKNINETERAKETFLYILLSADNGLKKLIKRLEEEKTIDINKEKNKETLISLVNLSSKAKLEKNSAPLLTARYHFFVKSLESLSICFAKKKGNAPKLLFGRHKTLKTSNGNEVVAFELYRCIRCGQPYLYGHLMDNNKFVSYPRKSSLDEDIKSGDLLAINLDEIVESPEDEEALSDEKPPIFADDEEKDENKSVKISSPNLSEPLYLCAHCGLLCNDCSSSCPECMASDWVKVRRVYNTSRGAIKVCPACGGQAHHGSSIIRGFSTSEDAVGAVLTHALMYNIPSTKEVIKNEDIDEKPRGRFAKKLVTKKTTSDGKRRLLAFSDSRQDAAYFSTYLNRTAKQILHRQLIIKAIRNLLKDNPGKHFDCSDLVNPLIKEAQLIGLFGPGFTEISKESEVSKWLTAELANIQRRYGLEGVGLITWKLKYRQELINIVEEDEEGLVEDYNLNAEEFVDLLEILLTDLRRRNVLQPLPNVNIKETYFWPRNRPYTITQSNPNPKLSIASWFPQSKSNVRYDFIERLFNRIGIKYNEIKVNNLLEDLWSLLKDYLDELPILETISSVNTLWGGKGNDGTVFRLRWDAWIGNLNNGKNSNTLYKCDKCSNITYINLKGVCPTYKCTGNLYPIEPEEEFRNDHYRILYQSEPVVIEVEEHTAQITTHAGAKRQQDFCNDNSLLNVLSCSTTFELGVDVGQLHAVFMRNVPPTVANYIQRAGRAGRRISASAFVLTFVRNRSHDIGYFDSPEKLIIGIVDPTKIEIHNTRIARRHLHSVVLSKFWKKYPELFNGPEGKNRGQIQWFFFEPPDKGAKMVYDWLSKKPKDLYEELKRIFPSKITEELGINSWRWCENLVKPSDYKDPDFWDGILGLAQSEILAEYKRYEELQRKNPKMYPLAEKHKRRIREKQLLDFLASRNVLPKYGFPVDVVSLKVQTTDEWAQEIELERDLRMALSEYAPGCSLVANGRIIKSYALSKVPNKTWPEYNYTVCNECGRFYKSVTDKSEVRSTCECGNLLEKEGSFIEPIFGFTTFIKDEGETPVEVKPLRTYTTRVYFSHYEKEDKPFVFEGVPKDNIKIEKRYSRYGVLTVLNKGKSNRGFWICYSCGFGFPVAVKKPKSHKTPWGDKCKGQLVPNKHLGHEFQSDVLELRFWGSIFDGYGQDFWLSMTAALLAGASRALDIERDDIDGTVHKFGGSGYKSIVLYDNVPGGAGHVREISRNLKRVMEEAYKITSNCKGCSRDQSCNACLRTFRNQYAH